MADFREAKRDRTAQQLSTPAPSATADPKQVDRDQTAHQLDIPASAANALHKQGEQSSEKRQSSHDKTQVQVPNPAEAEAM
ncbi:hypothetical protein N7517_005602 [Penicillium concentricum]|uniref:Uncharacterized protein n=1 Tax=Penicillium concentricum TaxID=293559 RepID=A0A9W9S7P9_9EURO|nr:uncharacterized protein N7517_005602 [Penicillium concentricum]KAJ5373596.1 hypothetical protein N7517_005602 [Penicillium concentricum]